MKKILLNLWIWFKFKKIWFPIDLIKWIIIDLVKGKKRRFFGVHVFVAMPGEGKTLGMVRYLEHIRTKYREVQIYTNFGYIHEAKPILHWKEILTMPHRSVIAIDELQNTFSSDKWKDFPFEMLSLLTQQRKRELQFICSTQDWALVDIKFRRLTNYVVQCRNYFHLDRWFRSNYYRPDVYELKGQIQAKNTAPEWSEHYVACDKLYALYDTAQMIESINKEYKTGTELYIAKHKK